MKMKVNAICPYCMEKGEMNVKETGMVYTGTMKYKMYKLGCCKCGKSFWKHEEKEKGDKTKWNF